jgi:uncharacterized protein (DUF1697 family)
MTTKRIETTGGAPQYFAFLRVINVGGHTVTMARLRELFEQLGHDDVTTFIASGNVVFRSAVTDTQSLERQIEHQLEQGLGYAVRTYIRTAKELNDIVRTDPFAGAAGLPAGSTLYVAFMAQGPDAATRRKVAALRTDTDDFAVMKREVFWLRRVRLSDAPSPADALEKTLRAPFTLRNMNTVRRMAAKYLP